AAGELGRAVIVGDEEIFISSDPCPSAPDFQQPRNAQLLTSIFAWLRQAPGVDAGAAEAYGQCLAPVPVSGVISDAITGNSMSGITVAAYDANTRPGTGITFTATPPDGGSCGPFPVTGWNVDPGYVTIAP